MLMDSGLLSKGQTINSSQFSTRLHCLHLEIQEKCSRQLKRADKIKTQVYVCESMALKWVIFDLAPSELNPFPYFKKFSLKVQCAVNQYLADLQESFLNTSIEVLQNSSEIMVRNKYYYLYIIYFVFLMRPKGF